MSDFILNIINEWHTAKACNGNEIRVQLVPLKRQQSSVNGFVWVEVGKKVLLASGEEVDFNQDGKSFYVALNSLYRLV